MQSAEPRLKWVEGTDEERAVSDGDGSEHDGCHDAEASEIGAVDRVDRSEEEAGQVTRGRPGRHDHDGEREEADEEHADRHVVGEW